mmetsp:Transcript_59169/g.132630  ORF Transcript_59169/g.132630 Transcript_59169/m.132630 type:complete len:692 (-) Transcript_59169:35-2110(-)
MKAVQAPDKKREKQRAQSSRRKVHASQVVAVLKHKQKIQELQATVLPPLQRVCLLAPAADACERLKAALEAIGKSLSSFRSELCTLVGGTIGPAQQFTMAFQRACAGFGQSFVLLTKDSYGGDLPGASSHRVAESEADLSLMLGQLGDIFIAVEGTSSSILLDEVVAARRKGALVLPLLRQDDGKEGPLNTELREFVLQKPETVKEQSWRDLVLAVEPERVAAAVSELMKQHLRSLSSLPPSSAASLSDRKATMPGGPGQALLTRVETPDFGGHSAARHISRSASAIPVHVPSHRLVIGKPSLPTNGDAAGALAKAQVVAQGLDMIGSSTPTSLIAAMLKVFDAVPQVGQTRELAELRDQLAKAEESEQLNSAWLEEQQRGLQSKLQRLEEMCERFAKVALAQTAGKKASPKQDAATNTTAAMSESSSQTAAPSAPSSPEVKTIAVAGVAAPMQQDAAIDASAMFSEACSQTVDTPPQKFIVESRNMEAKSASAQTDDVRKQGAIAAVPDSFVVTVGTTASTSLEATGPASLTRSAAESCSSVYPVAASLQVRRTQQQPQKGVRSQTGSPVGRSAINSPAQDCQGLCNGRAAWTSAITVQQQRAPSPVQRGREGVVSTYQPLWPSRGACVAGGHWEATSSTASQSRSRGASPAVVDTERRLQLLTNMEQLESLTRKLERLGCIPDNWGAAR